MKALKSTLALGAFFVLALSVSACGSSGVPSDSVAVVAGNPITRRAHDHWMYIAAQGQAAQNPGAPVIVPNDPPSFQNCITQVRKQFPQLAKTPAATIKSDCGQLFTALSSQVMQFLITGYWYQAEAAAQHIKITPAQINQALAVAKKQQFPNAAAFQSFLTQTGQTESDIVFRVRLNQIFTKLLAEHPSGVTSAQIKAYYDSHLSQFGSPQKRDIRIVLTKTKSDAMAAKSALSHGKSFSAVAKQYSTDATTKNNGGLLAGVTNGQEERALDQAAFSARPGPLMGPVQGQFGYYLFEVTKITPAKQQSLAQVTPQIRMTLTTQAQSNAQAAVEAQAKKHWLRKTTCAKLYATAYCSGYKAPKATAAPVGAPPAGSTPPPAVGSAPPPSSPAQPSAPQKGAPQAPKKTR